MKYQKPDPEVLFCINISPTIIGCSNGEAKKNDIVTPKGTPAL
ncbi:hypothetical protein PRVXT_000349 [Proteinivorax tanatarense]|uniref:Uncharacterized protein n=1 Tax=Proteinivorax tanatarense TaxID=1260629 RepID=A0AAU7VM88_9FIRM